MHDALQVSPSSGVELHTRMPMIAYINEAEASLYIRTEGAPTSSRDRSESVDALTRPARIQVHSTWRAANAATRGARSVREPCTARTAQRSSVTSLPSACSALRRSISIASGDGAMVANQGGLGK